MEIGLYLLIFLLSIVAIAVSVYAAGIEGNIVHLENNREPDAGVSLLGYILFPIFFIGVCTGQSKSDTFFSYFMDKMNPA